MSGAIGWRFPPTGGGTYDGWNDAGVAQFDGAHDKSLARETIQNSLDARDDSGKPVEVEFDVRTLDSATVQLPQLSAAIEACLKEPELREKDELALTEALTLSQEQQLTCLRIADRHTTGLRGSQWDALVKARGTSVKRGPGAGGSHGIGKFAPYTVSPLRTVFYWTRTDSEEVPREAFQGRSILMSHTTGGEVRQGTGYWGRTHNCSELTRTDIPVQIRDAEMNMDTSFGTSLWIAGFQGGDGWQTRIARSVLTSFFGAIQDGELSVLIEPSAEMERNDLFEINQGTIGLWFDYLSQGVETEAIDTEDQQDVEHARMYWELIREDSTAERQFPDLGFCKLWVSVADGLPNRVALMRKTGMLITTQQRGLIRFRGLQDFIAICRFEGDDGNEFLRKMENPRHDQFEPDHLPPAQKAQGKRALNQAVKWIRDELLKQARVQTVTGTINATELARLLPDLEPEDLFGGENGEGNQGREPQFDGLSLIRLKPRRDSSSTTSLIDSAGDDGGGGDENGGGGTSNGGGGGVGSGNGGGGTDGSGVNSSTRKQRQRLKINDVRLSPIAGQTGRYRVSFSAVEGGLVDLEFSESGDSSYVPRRDVRAHALDGSNFSLRGLALQPGERVMFEITADLPIGERAWIVSAVKQTS